MCPALLNTSWDRSLPASKSSPFGCLTAQSHTSISLPGDEPHPSVNSSQWSWFPSPGAPQNWTVPSPTEAALQIFEDNHYDLSTTGLFPPWTHNLGHLIFPQEWEGIFQDFWPGLVTFLWTHLNLLLVSNSINILLRERETQKWMTRVRSGALWAPWKCGPWAHSVPHLHSTKHRQALLDICRCSFPPPCGTEAHVLPGFLAGQCLEKNKWVFLVRRWGTGWPGLRRGE